MLDDSPDGGGEVVAPGSGSGSDSGSDNSGGSDSGGGSIPGQGGGIYEQILGTDEHGFYRPQINTDWHRLRAKGSDQDDQ